MLVPDSDATKALRALTRGREDLVRTRVSLANELRDQLGCFWPGAVKVFAEIDSPIALAFLKQYPTPADARTLGEHRMARFLARHGDSGRRCPKELLDRLQGAAQGRGASWRPRRAGRSSCRSRYSAKLFSVAPHVGHDARWRSP